MIGRTILNMYKGEEWQLKVLLTSEIGWGAFKKQKKQAEARSEPLWASQQPTATQTTFFDF